MSDATLGDTQVLPGVAAWRAEAASAVQQLAETSAHARETALASLTRLCAALPRYTANDASQATASAGPQRQEGGAENEEYEWLSNRLLELLAQGQPTQEPSGPSSSADGVPGVHKSEGWEARQGAFLGSKALLENWCCGGAREYCGRLAELAVQSLDDEEARVRLAVAESMAAISQQGTSATITSLCSFLLTHIQTMLDDPRCSKRYTQGLSPDVPLLQEANGTAGPRRPQREGEGREDGSGSTCGTTRETEAGEGSSILQGPQREAHTHSHSHSHSHSNGCSHSHSQGQSDDGSGEEGPSSPRADSLGLQAALSWGTRGTPQPPPPSVAGAGAGLGVARGMPPVRQGAGLEAAGGEGGFKARSDAPELYSGPGRSLETSVRAVQQLLEGLQARQKLVARPAHHQTVVPLLHKHGQQQHAQQPEHERGQQQQQLAQHPEQEREQQPQLPEGKEGGVRVEQLAPEDALGRELALKAWPLILQAGAHPNRFVREAAFFALAAVFPLLDAESDSALVSGSSAAALAGALGDNWSQVRYAASVALRRFLAFAGPRKAAFFPALLPPMVFNRYYGAEGVRLYSQATWQEAMGLRGRDEVAKHIGAVVDFYIAQSCVGNFMARETACLCIREVADKIERGALQAHVPRLVAAVRRRHADAFWPVRVAACSASQRLVANYPSHVQALWGDLTPAWTSSLLDSMPTVRQDAAAIMGSALGVTLKPLALEFCLQFVAQNLPRAMATASSLEHQPGASCSHSQGAAASGSTLPAAGTPAGFPPPVPAPGGLRVMRLDLKQPSAEKGHGPESGLPPGPGASTAVLGHGQAGTGLLEAKLESKFEVSYTTVRAALDPQSGPATRGAPEQGAPAAQSVEGRSMSADGAAQGDGGALVQGLVSQAQSRRCSCGHEGSSAVPAWVQSEAAVLLLKELSAVDADHVAQFLPQLADLAGHCAKSGSGGTGNGLLCTIWVSLPAMARGVGKRKFKGFLDPFLEPLFTCLAGQGGGEAAAVVASTAAQCVSHLQLFVGPSIFEGRLSPGQRQILAMFRQRRGLPSSAGEPSVSSSSIGVGIGPRAFPSREAPHEPLRHDANSSGRANVIRECFGE